MSLESSLSYSLGRTPTAMFAHLPPVELLEGLNDNDLEQIVHEVEMQIQHYKLENEIFHKFLIRQESWMIADMDRVLKKAEELHHKSHVSLETLNNLFASDVTVASRKPSQLIMIGPRINLSQKTDIILREFEETEIAFKNFTKLSKMMKAKLQAENEELRMELCEVLLSIDTFERVIVTEGVSKATQKIPAEKFIRFMQDWLRNAQILLEKLRLRTISFKIQLRKLKALLVHKQDLSTNVDVADFDVMQIEKARLIGELKQRNKHLIDLKQMTTKGNTLLLVNKELLRKQCETLDATKQMTGSASNKVQILMQEAEVTEQEVKRLRVKYRKLRKLADIYHVPSTLEYIRKKAELRELLRELKAMRRKERLVENGLKTYTKMMCKLKDTNKPDDWWYGFGTNASIVEQLSDIDPAAPSSSESCVL